MTTRELTSALSIAPSGAASPQPLRERLFRTAFGVLQWPWLLRSLYGGTKASKSALLDRLDLPEGSLPHLGSWKADTFLLHRLVDLIGEIRPRQVVELGSGATTLVLAKALAIANTGAMLHSYDQNPQFVDSVRDWLGEHDLFAELSHAPLTQRIPQWPGLWYKLQALPAQIDLLVVDGPPWAVHPFVRGAAESLFPRLSPGGIVVLDDAARPGERIVGARWRQDWPQINFRYERGGSKGTLIGRRKN